MEPCKPRSWRRAEAGTHQARREPRWRNPRPAREDVNVQIVRRRFTPSGYDDTVRRPGRGPHRGTGPHAASGPAPRPHFRPNELASCPRRAHRARPGPAGPRAGSARPRRVPALAGLRPRAHRRRGPPGRHRGGPVSAGAGRPFGRRGHRDHLRGQVPGRRGRERGPAAAGRAVRPAGPVAGRPAPRSRVRAGLGTVRGQHGHRAAAPGPPGTAPVPSLRTAGPGHGLLAGSARRAARASWPARPRTVWPRCGTPRCPTCSWPGTTRARSTWAG